MQFKFKIAVQDVLMKSTVKTIILVISTAVLIGSVAANSTNSLFDYFEPNQPD